SRADSIRPYPVCSVAFSSAPSNSRVSPVPAPYGPSSSRPSPVAAAVSPQPVQIRPRARRSRRPSRQQTVRNTAAPSSASPANPSQRIPVNTWPTTPLTAPLSGTLLGVSTAPLPTAKEYAPPTGCESADTTRQLTRQPPSGRPACTGTVTVVASPSGCRGGPVSTRLPVRSSTRRYPVSIDTGSENRRVTASGGLVSRAPSLGAALTSSACALAGR